jgi:hypothetical protein
MRRWGGLCEAIGGRREFWEAWFKRLEGWGFVFLRDGLVWMA